MAAKMLTNSELALFCQQMEMIIDSDEITVEEGITLMGENAQTKLGQQITAVLANELAVGNKLWQALEKAEMFPPYMVGMIKIGEETGNTDTVLKALASYYEKQEKVSVAIKNAVRYPLMMIIMMLCVIFVLLTKVMPVFAGVYAQLGSSMSGVAGAILNTGKLMSEYSLVLVIIIGAITAFAFYCVKTEKGIKLGEKMFAKLPLTRSLYEKIGDARFAYSLALITAAGLNGESGLDNIKEMVQNALCEKRIETCKQLIDNGENFENAVIQSELFRGLYAKMVTIGFKTGNAPKVMENISKNLTEEIDLEINQKIASVEPVLVGIFTVIVGLILLSVILPLMGIMSAIG